MEKYYNKSSVSSKIVNFLLKFTNYKKSSSNINNAKKFISNLKKKNFDNKYELYLDCVINNKMKVYSFNGSIDKPLSGGFLIYVHGGSYVENANYWQIKFVKEMAVRTNSTLIFCDYPLAPYSNAIEMFDLFESIYDLLIKKNVAINMFGDSAGGGFAIAFDNFLASKGKILPKNVLALSPWLDVSMSNDNIYEAAKLDNMCDVDGTRYMGELWAGDIDTKSSLISPLYGNYSDIENITIITGGYDILKYQCSEFHEKLKSENIKHNYLFFEKQGHIFAILPIKESRIVLEEIVNIINGVD